MKVICTRCGGTNIACEAIVNPNTGKIIDYLDESFMHANCGDCKEEVVITDVDRVKKDIDSMFFEFVKKNGKEPEYVECQIVWKDNKPEEERFTLTLTDEERLLIEERIKAGYYSAENIEKRREEAHKAKMMEKRAEICEQYDKIIRNAETDKKVMLCVFDYGLSTDNVIYYNHTNTLSFNWRDYGEKITQEEFDDFVNNVDRSQLPEGIKFELK